MKFRAECEKYIHFPHWGKLEELPPLFINAGNIDELFDDARKFAEKVTWEVVDAFFREGQNMIHCYPLLAPLFNEASEAMAEIEQYIKERLA